METREEQINEKVHELGQACFPDECNIWARENYEAQKVEWACKQMLEWADEHPNLYNDEKYHTVKVSCLDELNRKAQLYDEFKFVLYDDFLKKACEYLYKLNQMNFKEYGRHCPLVNVSDFRKAMEEYEVYSK